VGKIVNRPKYVTDLGKLIVFPIPSALGAFTGYKLSYVLLELINKYIEYEKVFNNLNLYNSNFMFNQ